jgi:hypothetical protein
MVRRDAASSVFWMARRDADTGFFDPDVATFPMT